MAVLETVGESKDMSFRTPNEVLVAFGVWTPEPDAFGVAPSSIFVLAARCGGVVGVVGAFTKVV